MTNAGISPENVASPLVPGIQITVAPKSQALVFVRFIGDRAKRVDVFFPELIRTLNNCDMESNVAVLALDNPEIAPQILSLQPLCSLESCHYPMQPLLLSTLLQYDCPGPMRHWLFAAATFVPMDTISITIIVQPGIVVGIPGDH